MRSALYILFGFCVAATLVFAQEKARLTGRVTDALTHQPITGVHVGGTFGGRFTGTLSAIDGTYALEDLNPGTANMTVNLENYRMIFGNRDAAAAFTLAAGEAATRNFEMHPLGHIRGRLIDRDTGEPIEGHAVSAFREMPLPGHMGFMGSPAAETKGGAYDIRNLEPGDYLVGIESGEEPRILAAPGKNEARKSYGQRWYPDVPRRDMATVVHLGEGESRSVDLAFESRETHSISGDFEAPAEFANQPVSLRLDTAGSDGLPRMVELRAGPFRVENLAAGHYRLVFTAGKKVDDLIGLREDEACADYDFEITDHDIEAVRIVLQRGAGVDGTVRMLEDDVPLPAKASVTLLTTAGWFARLSDGGMMVSGPDLIRSAPVESGRFQQEPLRPGEYWPMIDLPEGYAVVEVRFAGAKSRFDTITLTSAGTPLTFVLTAHPGSLAGTVATKEKALVIVLPDPVPDKPGPSALWSVETGPDGTFAIRNLAPGNYKAVALTGAGRAKQGDLVWLRDRMSKADPIEVRAGQAASVSIKP